MCFSDHRRRQTMETYKDEYVAFKQALGLVVRVVDMACGVQEAGHGFVSHWVTGVTSAQPCNHPGFTRCQYRIRYGVADRMVRTRGWARTQLA